MISISRIILSIITRNICIIELRESTVNSGFIQRNFKKNQNEYLVNNESILGSDDNSLNVNRLIKNNLMFYKIRTERSVEAYTGEDLHPLQTATDSIVTLPLSLYHRAN